MGVPGWVRTLDDRPSLEPAMTEDAVLRFLRLERTTNTFRLALVLTPGLCLDTIVRSVDPLCPGPTLFASLRLRDIEVIEVPVVGDRPTLDFGARLDFDDGRRRLATTRVSKRLECFAYCSGDLLRHLASFPDSDRHFRVLLPSLALFRVWC